MRSGHRARLQFHDEKDEVADQSAHGQHFDGEEVGSGEAVPMGGHERLPGRVHATLRRGPNAVVPEDRFDRVAGEIVAESFQPAADARVAQVGFSFAMQTMSAAMSGLVLGRPGRPCFEPSYFLATSLRYQRTIVSGVTMPATSARRRPPRTLPFTAKRRRWSSVRRSRRGPCARRTRFSSSR